ncbi:MAG: ATP-binding protein [Acidobacteriota bacterium]|nr:ATP-binding protein [Acidobacteriota bacterium]
MEDPCPICGGSGLTLVEQTGPDGLPQRFARPCACRIERRAARMLQQARIPRRYEHCSLDSYETMHATATDSLRRALRIARRFASSYPVETAGKGLLLTGSSGLGKTHLAVSILKTLIAERGATGVFWEHKELLDELRSIYSLRTAGAESRLLKHVTTCDILVLDDLGDITPSDWSWDTTSYILNSRYNENLSTIITTNLDNEPRQVSAEPYDRFAEARRAVARETLGDRIGERMRSRLQEMCVVVEVQGEDFRQHVKRASFA